MYVGTAELVQLDCSQTHLAVNSLVRQEIHLAHPVNLHPSQLLLPLLRQQEHLGSLPPSARSQTHSERPLSELPHSLSAPLGNPLLWVRNQTHLEPLQLLHQQLLQLHFLLSPNKQILSASNRQHRILLLLLHNLPKPILLANSPQHRIHLVPRHSPHRPIPLDSHLARARHLGLRIHPHNQILLAPPLLHHSVCHLLQRTPLELNLPTLHSRTLLVPRHNPHKPIPLATLHQIKQTHSGDLPRAGLVL
jgi:hypothetical protein